MDSKKSNCYPKKVFIERDYSKGTNICFQTEYPSELKGSEMTDQMFYEFVTKLNSMYKEAEQMNTKICMESCFACITAYITYLCLDTYFDKCLKKISAFIEEQNDIIFKPKGIYVIDPIERGLRVIEIVIKEPKIP